MKTHKSSASSKTSARKAPPAKARKNGKAAPAKNAGARVAMASAKRGKSAAKPAAPAKGKAVSVLKKAAGAVASVVKGAAAKAAPPKASAPAPAPAPAALTTAQSRKAGKAANSAAAAAAKAREKFLAKASGAPLKPARGSGDAVGEAVCREVACEGLATSAGYCRLHYIKNWKKIKRKELILKEGKLNQYIEELVAKYPDKYIEAIRQDLANDKDFAKVIYDLDLDESVDEFEGEGENVDALIDNIKRDFEDEGEGF
jgi:hypothetical protein